MKKKAVMVALRRLGRREIRKLLENRSAGRTEKPVRRSRVKNKKKTLRK
jgi:hypothetical protein